MARQFGHTCAACAATSSGRLRISLATTILHRASWTQSRCAAAAGMLVHVWCTCGAIRGRAVLTCLCWPQMHVVKNKLVDLGLLGADLRVPLILGIWCVLLLSHGCRVKSPRNSMCNLSLHNMRDVHKHFVACTDRQSACAQLSRRICMCREFASTGVTNSVHCCRGGKGQGKSFQTELAMKKLGIEPVIMSAGVCLLCTPCSHSCADSSSRITHFLAMSQDV